MKVMLFGWTVAALALAGCGPVAVQMVAPDTARVERTTSYVIGEPITASVGDRVMRVQEHLVVLSNGQRLPYYDRAVGGESNFDLTYSGQDGTSIRFQYREYTADNLARDAFSQDLTYPRDSEVIRFRDYEMRVVELTPDSITVIVLAEPPVAQPAGVVK
jgi:hypothetical protein